MRFTFLLICLLLAGGCAMPPVPAAQPAPVAPREDVAAIWERYEDAKTGWSFAFPPGSRAARETEELPWYTLITPGEPQWTRTDWRGDHTFIYTPSDTEDARMMNFIIELRYGAEASREDVVACRSAAETVLATFKVLE